ncbi:hypothetical protein DIPPA_08434 [Diplonema papillatum]|nr:hypothetical protein DIPPA_08434 [Diplonema papillatum]
MRGSCRALLLIALGCCPGVQGYWRDVGNMGMTDATDIALTSDQAYGLVLDNGAVKVIDTSAVPDQTHPKSAIVVVATQKLSGLNAIAVHGAMGHVLYNEDTVDLLDLTAPTNYPKYGVSHLDLKCKHITAGQTYTAYGGREGIMYGRITFERCVTDQCLNVKAMAVGGKEDKILLFVTDKHWGMIEMESTVLKMTKPLSDEYSSVTELAYSSSNSLMFSGFDKGMLITMVYNVKFEHQVVIDTRGAVTGIATLGAIVVLAAGTDVFVYDVSTPTSPAKMEALSFPNSKSTPGLLLSPDLAVFLARGNYLMIVKDIDDTKAPATDTPQTGSPRTETPPTLSPTRSPATDAPATEAPATSHPLTSSPHTLSPPTSHPPTSHPPTSHPPTNHPPTKHPPTSHPPTNHPLTDSPATSHPLTPFPRTLIPSTSVPVTDTPVTPVVSEPEPRPEKETELPGQKTIERAGMAATLVSAASLSSSSTGSATRLVVVSQACRTAENDEFATVLHPTQLTINGSIALGAVVSNFAIIAAFSVLSYAVFRLADGPCRHMLPVRFREGIDTQGFLRFPSAPLFVLQLLYQGTLLGAMVLILQPVSALVFIGAICVLIGCLLVPIGCFVVVRESVPARAYYAEVESDTAAWKQILMGKGEWVAVERSTHWVNRWATVVRPFRQDTAWFFLVEMASSVALAGIQAVRSESLVGCGHVKLFSSVIFFILLLAEMYVSPHARLRDTVGDTIQLGAQSSALVLVSIAYYKEDTRYWTFTAANMLLMSSVAVSILKAVVDGGTEAYILYSGRRRKLQAQVFEATDHNTNPDKPRPSLISSFCSPSFSFAAEQREFDESLFTLPAYCNSPRTEYSPRAGYSFCSRSPQWSPMGAGLNDPLGDFISEASDL